MVYAEAIHMKQGSEWSKDLLEIDTVYLTGCNTPGFYKKEDIYDYLKNNPGTIKVKIYPYPNVEGCLSKYNEKYVKSTPNANLYDNLLALPRK